MKAGNSVFSVSSVAEMHFGHHACVALAFFAFACARGIFE